MMEQKFLSPPDAADFLGLSEEELFSYANDGFIKVYPFTQKTKRFEIEELESFDLNKAKLFYESLPNQDSQGKEISEVEYKPEVLGAIYFIGPDEKIFKRSVANGTTYRAVKIGFTTSLKRRLLKLQTGSPLSLHLLAVLEDKPMVVEKNLHRLFYKRTMSGEWFYYDNDMSDSLFRYINEHYVGGKRECKRVMKKYS